MSKLTKFYLGLLVVFLLHSTGKSQGYSTFHQGVNYQSAQPHNLNVYYFKASDLPLDTSYLRRHSQMLIWLRQYYSQQMQLNGYGNKTFGLWTASDSVRIVVIHGKKPLNFYRNNLNPSGNDSLIQEYRDFKTLNPSNALSEHHLVIVATPGVNQMNGLPYYGIGKTCFATDYPQLDLQYLGQSGTLGQQFVTYFGGIAHELGHALNLPHSHQTLTEQQSPAHGTNLMADGNYTLTASPTFINRAGAAILNRCQLFNTQPATSFYTGHVAGLVSLYSQWSNGSWTVSGRWRSNVPVTDINVYQDPFASPSAGYRRIAFSASPLGLQNDSFRIVMPVSEVMLGTSQYPPTGPWNLAIELVLENGETEEVWYPFRYQNQQPIATFQFDDLNCSGNFAPGFSLTQIGSSFAPGQACFNATDSSLVMRTWATGPGATQDKLPFLWRPMAHGDSISMRILQVSDTWNDQIGLMVRASLDSNSAYCAISGLDNRGVFWSWRGQTGQPSGYNLVSTLPLPFWIKVVRSGNWIDGFHSPDGINWTPYYRRNLNLPTQALAGIFIGKNGARGKVDQIKFNGLTVSTQEAERTRPITLIPNPFSENFEIITSSEKQAIAFVKVIDTQGKVCYQQLPTSTNNHLMIPGSGLNKGLYFVEVMFNDGSRVIEKVLKQQ